MPRIAVKTALTLLLWWLQPALADPLALIADLNGRYGSTSYHPRVSEALPVIVAHQPEVVIIAGDMIAGQANPPLSPARTDAMWRAFDQTVMAPLAEAGIPVLAVPGNHDASAYPPYRDERARYESFWLQRTPELPMAAGSRYPWYYSVDLDGVTFVGLDVTAPGELDSIQQAFLEQRRSAARASGTLLLVVTHLPLLPLGQGREDEVFSIPGGSRPGELWVSGHHHVFYPGQLESGARHLGLPALGGNRRRWVGTPVKSPFGFVLLEDAVRADLYAWPGFILAVADRIPAAIGKLQYQPGEGDRRAQ